MTAQKPSILHVIHDFLPRHRAGAEIYAAALCHELQKTHRITVFAAEYDPQRAHGEIVRRTWRGLPVIEVINNWAFASFEETYRSALLGERFEQVLREVAPDVVHVHNLLNLSLDLPRRARALGIPTVATLHDYTLVCPSGGQRIHRAEQHVCHKIEPERCARCFEQSPLHTQMRFGGWALSGPASSALGDLAIRLRRAFPRVVTSLASHAARIGAPDITPEDIRTRLAFVKGLFEEIDRFVAPSAALAREFVALGLSADKIRVRDYGFPPRTPTASHHVGPNLRVGFVGTLVWHKGAHILLDAIRLLPRQGLEVTIHGDLDVSPDYSKSLREKAAGLPVVFAGEFEETEKQDVYSEIDLLIVPSLWMENSPLVIHEAFQAGIPVLGSAIGGIPDLVTDGVTGRLFAPGSPEGLATAIREVLDRPELRLAWADALPKVLEIAEDARAWAADYHELKLRDSRPGARRESTTR